MRLNLRFISAAIVCLLFTEQTFSQCILPTINLQNPSFEGVPQAHVTPGPWSICMPGQTPDTQPGSWGVTMPPTNGGSYLGLVHQSSTGWQEGAAEPLNTPLVAGTTYTFSIDVANSSINDGPPIGIIPGCAELIIWGGYGPCDQNTLLWASGNITPFDVWMTRTVSFVASQNFTWIFFQVNSLGCTDGPYILVDNIGTITPTPLQLIPTVTAATCSGLATGSAYMSYSGGTLPLTFNWSNGVTTPNNPNLFAGTYTLTVVDGANCTATASITVTEPTPVSVTTTFVDASCAGNDGSATAHPSGGTAAFTYLWSNSGTTQTISSLAPGTYSVVVSDANGCTGAPGSSVTINALGGVTLSPEAYDAACGNNNGSAIANATSGSPPYIYIWSNGGTTDTIIDLGPGTYDVTVTGSNGCSASASLSVGTTNNLGITAFQNSINCGGNTGSARVVVTAGTPPYTYEWSTGETTDEIFNLGTGTYSVTVIGFGGCSATTSIDISTADIIAPSAICQDITRALTGNSLTITAADVDGGSFDDCGNVTLSATPLTFDCSNLGANAVTLTAADISGNSSSCIATVTVIDNTSPVALCQDKTISLAGSSASITATDVDGGSSDECSVSLSVAPSSFDCSNLGANPVTLTATDGSLNSSTCSATVTVIDDTPPAAVCQDFSVALTGSSASVTAGDVDGGSTDNCAITTRNVVPSSFNCSNVGGNPVILTVADASGNSSSCNATVTVMETEPPVAGCQDISVALVGSSVIVSTADIDRGSTDNCSLFLSLFPTTFDCSNLGPNAVTLTATDSAGNSSTCGAIVTVIDDTQPVAICRNTTVALSGTSVSISAADINDGSSDNCSVFVSASPLSFTCSNIGANSVTLTASDGSGNTSSCIAIVNVADTESPVAICQTFGVTLTGGVATITPDDIDNGSTDNCSVTLAVFPSTFNCTNVGSNAVTLTATDPSGNSSTCTVNVTVVGGPVFTCSITSIPEASSQITNAPPTTIYLGYGPQRTKLAVEVTARGLFTYSWAPATGLSCSDCDAPIFSPTAQGNYTFTVTVTDFNGCTSSCSITICVLDIRAIGGCDRNSTGSGPGDPNGGGLSTGNSPGKVYICHLPPGNPTNMQVICVGVAAVPAHVPLHGGDHLGRCNQTCATAKTEDEGIPELLTDGTGEGFEMFVYPNPFSSQFHIKVETISDQRIDVRMFDVLGQLIVSRGGIEPNEDILLGDNLNNGFYFLEVTQAGFKKIIRLTKAK